MPFDDINGGGVRVVAVESASVAAGLVAIDAEMAAGLLDTGRNEQAIPAAPLDAAAINDETATLNAERGSVCNVRLNAAGGRTDLAGAHRVRGSGRSDRRAVYARATGCSKPYGLLVSPHDRLTLS